MPVLAISPALLSRESMLRPGHGLAPEIWLVGYEDTPAVLKDYATLDPLLRWTLGRWLTRREMRAYRNLDGVPGVPRLIGRVGATGLLLERIEGIPVYRFRRGELSPAFFERLIALVHRLHERGVAHGDMKSRFNVLVGPGEAPYVVDFASAVTRGSQWNLAQNWIFAKLCQVDRNAIARLKRLLAPEQLTAEEARRLAHPLLLERIAKHLFGR